MSNDPGCPNLETLASFLLGKLAPEHEDTLTRHLEVCPACEARAEQLEQETDPLIDALRLPPREPRALRAEAPVAVAAALAPVTQPAPFHLEGFEILEEIGRGGMGVVYRAFQHRLKRLVAIKMILTGTLAGAEERVRFLLEGELLARLSHPNFVQVYEVGTVELSAGTLQPYLVLEHVEGGSLKARMAKASLSYLEAARLVLTLARAMETAHAQGILHRDLKPANVLIAHDGTLKITDFGLAKELGTDASLTPLGLTVGTPCYMAPEQATSGATVGPATDVYALGIMLYEMLAGRPPFEGDTPMEVLLQVLQRAPVSAARLRHGVPLDLETISLKCLEKDPHRRYARAADLADDLQRWLEHRPIQARPAGWLEQATKWARRHPLPAALLLFSILSLMIGSAASTYFGVSAVNRAEETRKALAKEKVARTLADKATEAERWERYLAEIAAASSSLQLNNVEPARRALESAPAEYRNWEWRHLQSQLDGARSVFRGHEAIVLDAVFCLDDQRLATWSYDNTLRLWDVTTGKQVAVLPPPEKKGSDSLGLGGQTAIFPAGSIKEIAVSPDGSRLASGGDRVRLWDTASGNLRWEGDVSRQVQFCPAWSPDGRYLAGGGGEGWLRVRDAATGRVLFQKRCEPSQNAVAFSPDSKYVAAGLADNTVPVWESASGKEVVALRGHTDHVKTIAYSPDGRRIATGSMFPESEVRLWNAATGELLARSKRGKGHDNEVSFLAFSPDGRRIASASMDQTVRLWDGLDGRALAKLQGHTGFVKHLAFSPNGAELVSASADQTLRLWDAAAGRLIAVLRGHTNEVQRVSYGCGGSLLASASSDGTVRLWDTTLIARNGVLIGHTTYVYDVAFRPVARPSSLAPRPSADEVASAGWDGKVLLWDPTTGRQTAELPHQSLVVSALAYSPDGRKLAVAVRKEGVWLWDLATRKPTHLWKGLAGDWKGDTHVAFNPEGTLLAGGSLEGPVRLWNPETGKEMAVRTGHDGCSRDVAFRPDGKQLASAGEDGTVRLWDVASRQLTAVLRGSSDLYRLAYSADGRLLAAGGGDKAVRVWEVETHKEIGAYHPGSTVYGLAFNPDGTRLACACADNTIRLWDPIRLREVVELRGHGAYVHAVAFSPDGTRLVSGSGDSTVRIWDTLPAQERASHRETR